MAQPRKIVAIDCETDPFKHGRIPEPFVWGAFDGKDFTHYDDAADMLADFSNKNVYMFAHNGGKFDFMFLLKYIDQTRAKIIKSRIVEFKIGKAVLRDSWSIIPIALREYRKDEIEYWKLEKEHRGAHRAEILRYLETDCVALYELVGQYFARVGKKTTIASNALAFAKKQGIEVGRTNRRFDDRYRPYYHGGRCEAFKAGEFNSVNVYDLVSAYPFAMTHLHPTGTRVTVTNSTLGKTDEQIQRSFIDLTGFSHGAFPLMDKISLRFPHALGRYHVTGWEFLAAKKHGLITHERINEIHIFEDTIHFRPYVDHWFKVKQSGKENGNKADYIIGKIMMNSLYGKLAQNPVNYRDYQLFPAGTEPDLDNGWTWDKSFDNLELHSRDALYNIKKRATNKGEDWNEYPVFYNVATGASITGFTRAHLLDAIHTIGANSVLYCDTDCVFVDRTGDTFALKQDGKLGSWEWEGTADPCVIAGKKLYALEYVNGPAAGKAKLRAKGAPEQKVTLDDVRQMVNNPGLKLEYKFDAPTFSIGKKTEFLVRQLRATAR